MIFPLVVDDDHRVGRGFEQRAEFFFGLFSHSDISYGARDQHAVGSLDRAKTDLERKFRTIFSQSKKLQLFTHRTLAAGRERSRAMMKMAIVKALRNQHLHRIA